MNETGCCEKSFDPVPQTPQAPHRGNHSPALARSWPTLFYGCPGENTRQPVRRTADILHTAECTLWTGETTEAGADPQPTLGMGLVPDRPLGHGGPIVAPTRGQADGGCREPPLASAWAAVAVDASTQAAAHLQSGVLVQAIDAWGVA